MHPRLAEGIDVGDVEEDEAPRGRGHEEGKKTKKRGDGNARYCPTVDCAVSHLQRETIGSLGESNCAVQCAVEGELGEEFEGYSFVSIRSFVRKRSGSSNTYKSPIPCRRPRGSNDPFSARNGPPRSSDGRGQASSCGTRSTTWAVRHSRTQIFLCCRSLQDRGYPGLGQGQYSTAGFLGRPLFSACASCSTPSKGVAPEDLAVPDLGPS